MTDFKEGARLFSELANTYHILTAKKPKRFIPKGPSWTKQRQLEYAERQMAEHWAQMKLHEEICRNLAMICLGIDDLQQKLKSSVIS